MRVKGLKAAAAGLCILAASGTIAMAETAPAGTQPATETPATPPVVAEPAKPAATTTTPTTGKTTDQIPPSDETPAPVTPPPAPPPAAEQPAAGATPPAAAEDAAPAPDASGVDAEQPDAGAADGSDAPEELSLGEIPDIKNVDLTPETAKAAVDTYNLLKEKYEDAKLEDYETLQEFVDKDPQGKAFDADVKAAGFADVEIWNQTITTVSNTYNTLLNDQTADTKAQIAEVEKDTELAQDMKDKLLTSLRALIPTDGNRKVVQDLMNDPTYKEKLKLLEAEEE